VLNLHVKNLRIYLRAYIRKNLLLTHMPLYCKEVPTKNLMFTYMPPATRVSSHDGEGPLGPVG
jgi:hypothetical protein